MKNIFALYSYRIGFVAVGLLGIIFMTIVPVWGLLLTQGVARILFGLIVLCRFAVFACNAKMVNGRSDLFLWSLLTPYLIVFIIIKAVWATLRNQGIDWRGTHYSLQELKKQEPLLTSLYLK